VTLTFGLRTRVLLLVLLLAAAGAGLMVLNRLQRSDDSSTLPPSPATAHHAAAAPKPEATPATKPAAKHVTRPATRPAAKPESPSSPKPATRHARPSVAPAPQAGERLPAAIQQALSANRVVVVALYDPRAKIDDTALREATAGARLAGTTFVPVDVTKDEVDSLNARYGVIQDPAVLVLRPPGDLVVRIDGFADRDTVAQAAVNAAS
jgi:hypothetical protein